jgi:hypothetical protein
MKLLQVSTLDELTPAHVTQLRRLAPMPAITTTPAQR